MGRRAEGARRNYVTRLSVASPDMPGALEQSVALFQHPARDRSTLMATLIDQGGTTGSSHRSNPLG